MRSRSSRERRAGRPTLSWLAVTRRVLQTAAHWNPLGGTMTSSAFPARVHSLTAPSQPQLTRRSPTASTPLAWPPCARFASEPAAFAGPGDSQVRVNAPCGREALQPETIGLRGRGVAIVRTHAQLSRVRPRRCRSAVAPSERRRQFRRRPARATTWFSSARDTIAR